MKMRDYYDAKHGPGAWDRMHDLIEKKQIFGWTQPDIEVDGHVVSVFPGTDRECLLEDVQIELRKAFAQIGFIDAPDECPSLTKHQNAKTSLASH